ncbi:hypothetical protein HR060_00365 [Catenovulum sp. SM1970]|uniref:hypothetical protein n=1 Tax=Marinifaba aquimaris TaxID=2741323 RepID=UPI00157453C1|nr:hypothetical protein [Marinifaba aquimaris]NTS75302.1 hypothetical protein [Marinifaba aquimaris]
MINYSFSSERETSPPTNVINQMNQSLSAALSYSERSGYGWSLISSMSDVLDCSGTMAGVEQNKISQQVAKYSEQIESIYLTIEPVEGLLDVNELINSIGSSACKRIFISHSTQVSDDTSTVFRRWANDWSGCVFYLPYNLIAGDLASGVNTAQHYNRPWVSAICAGNLSGQKLPLDSLTNEFGFTAHIAEQVSHSRAIIYTVSESSLLACLPKDNKVGETIPTYGLNSASDIHSILTYLLKEGRYNVVLLCDLHSLASYVELGKIDEIIYHFSTQKGVNLHDSRYHDNQSVLDISDWATVSSTLVGECSRVVYLNRAKYTEVKNHTLLQSRLN